MDPQFDLAAYLQRRTHEQIQSMVYNPLRRVLNGYDTIMNTTRLDLTKHRIDTGKRGCLDGMTEVLVSRGFGKRTLWPEIGNRHRVLEMQTSRHDLAEQPHHSLVLERTLVALPHRFQNLGLAFRSVVIGGVAIDLLDARDLAGIAGALSDQFL